MIGIARGGEGGGHEVDFGAGSLVGSSNGRFVERPRGEKERLAGCAIIAAEHNVVKGVGDWRWCNGWNGTAF